MTESNFVKEQRRQAEKLEKQAERLHAKLEKLADSQDEKIASKAAADLTTIYVSELATREKEDRLGPLRAEIIELKRDLRVSADALSPITAERNALLLEVTTLREETVKSGPLQEQLDKLIAENADWKKAQHELLVAENQRFCWDAERARNQSRETLQSAERQFSTTGLEALLAEMTRIVEVHRIPEPDIWALPANVNPMFLTLWPGWSRIKASLFVGFMQSYPEPNEGFKQALERCLTARLPVRGSALIPLELIGIEPDPTAIRSDGPKTIEHLKEKTEVLLMMAERWPGVLHEVQQRVQDEQVRRQAEAMKHNSLMLDQQERDLKSRGYGNGELLKPVIENHWEGCGCPQCEAKRTGRESGVGTWLSEI